MLRNTREGESRPLLEQRDTIEEECLVDDQAFYVPPSITQAPGTYRLTISLDDILAKTVLFNIVP